MIHDNVQTDIRQKGLQAQWLDSFKVEHYPDPAKHDSKIYLYKERLQCALKKNAEWIRYHWFLGYMHYIDGNFDDAIKLLEKVIVSTSELFPVEQLNSAMVLITIYAKLNHKSKTFNTLKKSFELFDRNQDDFEVKINTRILPWLHEAKKRITNNELHLIKIYKFAK